MNTKVKSLLVAVILLGGTATAAYAGGQVDTTFDAANFSANSAIINNQYWPLPEKTTFVYRSVGKDGCQVNPVQVTDVTPVIADVTTRQVHDQVYEDDDCDGVGDFLSRIPSTGTHRTRIATSGISVKTRNPSVIAIIRPMCAARKVPLWRV